MSMEILEEAGIDYSAGLVRFRNNKTIYHEVLLGFLEDESFRESKDAFASNDYENLLLSIHELKGVSGNIGLSKLHNKAAVVVDLLRLKKYDEVPEAFREVEKEWIKVINELTAKKSELSKDI